MDENVAEQLLDLRHLGAQQGGILFERINLAQHHPPVNSPLQRRVFVLAEVHRGALAQNQQDFLERFLFGRSLELGRFVPIAGHDVRVAGNSRQFPPNPFRRQHEVYAARRDRAGRHRRILRGLLVLREGDTAGRFDRQQAVSSVRTVSGKDHANRPIVLLLGQRAEEFIHRQVRLGVSAR